MATPQPMNPGGLPPAATIVDLVPTMTLGEFLTRLVQGVVGTNLPVYVVCNAPDGAKITLEITLAGIQPAPAAS